MNRKQKFKKYIKENWILLILFLVFLTISIFGIVSKNNNNKILESDVKQAQKLNTRKNAILVNTNNPFYNTNGRIQIYNNDFSAYEQHTAYECFLDNNSTQINKEIIFNFIRNHPTLDYAILTIDSINEINLNTQYTTIIAQYGIQQVDLFYNNNLVSRWENNTEQDAQYNSKIVIENELIFNKITIILDARTQAFENIYINITNDTTEQIYDQGYTDGYNNAKNEMEQTTNNLLNTIAQQNATIQQLQETILNFNDNYSMTEDLFKIVDKPIDMLREILNWNLLGINLWAFFSAIITLLLAIWIIRRFI